MARDWRSRDERRRNQEEERERQNQIEFEALEAKDRLPLDYLIDQVSDMEDVRYVLRRLAKASALQTELIKGMKK
ncbi:hypothetical protein IB265_32740 [Ensifer sp. ENS10]|uniref:hypothetical protein n=1 Tax=Ensifer sp. ENS10 TaxID=2769286 RepID=UPI00177E8B4C|nr:hypothetical protein [Ensifer sp. ENS10]MBD9511525.1 hypothetical protein [Ensifer sp. ENS10]